MYMYMVLLPDLLYTILTKTITRNAIDTRTCTCIHVEEKRHP